MVMIMPHTSYRMPHAICVFQWVLNLVKHLNTFSDEIFLYKLYYWIESDMLGLLFFF